MLHKVTDVHEVTAEERAFLAALEAWIVKHYRPQGRFNGEFDAAVLCVEAVPWVDASLAAALDGVLPGKRRYKGGWHRGMHRARPVENLLKGLWHRGLLKATPYGRDHSWYDIIEPTATETA
jgi:hypothetical protein